MDEAMLSVSGVSKTYRRGSEEISALRGVTFSLRAGEFAVLLGPSGSGKSTLLSVLCGWERPDAGEVSVDGRPVTRSSTDWAELAVVPQTLGLMEELSVRDNVNWPVRLRGSLQAEVARTQELLDLFGLSELAHRYPDEISLGENQRTALARALVLHPRVFLADEPTSHQDEYWALRVLSIAREASTWGGSCLIVSHDPQAALLGSRTLTINDGKVAEVDGGDFSRTVDP
jgi:putative ABC transport system ATP-binding protein